MKHLTAIILSLGIAAGVAAPAPAVADTDRTIKIISGIAAAAVLAKIIDDRNDRKRDVSGSSVTRAGRLGSVEQTYDGRRIIDGRITPYGQTGPKDGRGYKKAPLPRACLVTVDTNRGDRLAYGTNCLNRSYKHVSKLPQSCETLIRTSRGLRSVYGARCLSRDGWQVASR